MTTFRIVRDHTDDRPTTGHLYAGDLELHTLELPWRGNEQNISCIPNGNYKCVYEESYRLGHPTPRLLNVPDRTGILIHSGNIEANTEGCILLGLTQVNGPDGQAVDLAGSREALGQFVPWLLEALQQETVFCQIYNVGHEPDVAALPAPQTETT